MGALEWGPSASIETSKAAAMNPPRIKPRIFAGPSRWPGVWVWRISIDDDPPCNYFEWKTAIRHVERLYRSGRI